MRSTPGRKRTISKLISLTEKAGGILFLPKAVTVDDDFLGAEGTARVTRIRTEPCGGALDLGDGLTTDHLSDEDLERILKATETCPTTLVITARRNLDGTVSAAFARIRGAGDGMTALVGEEARIDNDRTAAEVYSNLVTLAGEAREITGFTVSDDINLILNDIRRRGLRDIRKALRKELSGIRKTDLIASKTTRRHWKEIRKDETPADVCDRLVKGKERKDIDLSSVDGLTRAAVSCVLNGTKNHTPTPEPEIRIIGARNYDEVRDDCHAVKTAAPGDEVFARSARGIAEAIDRNCVLVPIPSHTGRATDTLTLAKAIRDALAEKGLRAPVIDGLECDPHESLCELKHRDGGDPDKTEIRTRVRELSLYEYLMDNTPVYLVDNVVDTGKTARAALRVLPADGIIAIGTTGRHLN